MAKEKSKTAKNLKKVKRALKTLGVNFLHFDNEEGMSKENDSNSNGGVPCDKEYCQKGML